MDRNFLPGPEGRDSIKKRLVKELRRELPPSLEKRLDGILDAALGFHPLNAIPHGEPSFDFRSLAGEDLVPARDDSFGAADFLKVSQVFERSLVGLISKSELHGDDRTRFVSDIQAFFDAFDTALLSQLEEELVDRGLLRPAPTTQAEPATDILRKLGLTRDLADEMTDPVLLTIAGRLVYSNAAADSVFPNPKDRESCCGANGPIGEYLLPGSSEPGVWNRRRITLPYFDEPGRETLAAWKSAGTPDGLATVIILLGAGKPEEQLQRINRLTREKRRFRTLYRLSKELLGGSDLESLFESVSKELGAEVQYDAIMLHLHKPADSRALFHLTTPLPPEALDLLLENSVSTLDAFVVGAEPSNVRKSLMNPDMLDSSVSLEVRSGNLFIFPITTRDSVLGSLGVYRSNDTPVSDDDLHLFSTFSNQLSLSLQNLSAFEGMRKLLRNNREQIDLARRVQLELLPEAETFSRLKFRTLFRPATGLSGDFYHFFRQDGYEGLVIGDASGHGISASLIMAAALASFQDACSDPGCEPDSILYKANSALKNVLAEDFFVVALVFVVDPVTLIAKYATAGQAGPFLLKPDGKMDLLKPAGIPLGMFEEPLSYDIDSIALHPGDRLLFFTDGAIENRNGMGELYGLNRLRKSVKRGIFLDGDELLASVTEEIADFIGDASYADDLTLVLMEVD